MYQNESTMETNMDAAFNYLKNIDSESEEMPAVAQSKGTSLYCLENTMEAKAQQLGIHHQGGSKGTVHS